MKPKLIHKEAMEFSFQAKQCIEKGDYMSANEYYIRAAEKEGELARFYFDKPESEPTRSTIIRSAVFLSLKAGLIAEAKQLIFWGLLNLQNVQIKEELEDALELVMALKNTDTTAPGYNMEYLRILRMKSVNYTMEPAVRSFGSLITLEMLKDFAGDFLRSLKSYANATFIRAEDVLRKVGTKVDDAAEQFEELVNPIITTASISSFNFAIANDFISRGEESELIKLKADIVINYHEKIFINPLNDDNIDLLKREYKDDEINQIFRPISRIKAVNSPYKVSYFDNEAFRKRQIPQIAKEQRKKLLPPTAFTQEDIGFLESSIVHARQLNDGKKKRSVIQKEQLKTYEYELKTNQIEPKEKRALILNEEIIVEVGFDAAKGFTFSYDDLGVSHTDIDYGQGLQTFNSKFYDRLITLIKIHKADKKNSQEWNTISRLMNNPESLEG